MRDYKLDRLFDRFRKRGNTAALAWVFDATAADLLGLAIHLVRDVGEGEDLVQQTFLTAIEKADRYDADRRLLPWLVGILVGHAHNARRRRVRTKDDPLPDLPGGLDPAEEAEASELSDLVRSALADLPAIYRKVLEPYLLRGDRAVDIARASGRSPGTVRVQLRRGLDELRRALPGGLSLGASITLGRLSLADVRATVLERATQVAADKVLLSASSFSTTSLLGGFAMLNKLGFAALLLPLVALLAWLLQSDSGELKGTASTNQEHELAGSAAARTPNSIVIAAETAASSTERVDMGRKALAGASGRILDELGEPVADVLVQLLELRPEMIEVPLTPHFDGKTEEEFRALNWSPLVSEDRTDEQGRFDFWGADPGGYHALGIDRGGQRPTFRMIDIELTSGERVDIGTIRLDAVRTVTGQVVDSDQQPVSGARVRAARLPQGAELLAELRPNVWLISADDDGHCSAIDVPDSFTRLFGYFPVPTARTDQQGHFELHGVSHNNRLSFFVDHAGQGLLTQPLPLEEQDAGILSFPVSRTFRGRVVDTAGDEVVGAQVLFGQVPSAGGASIAQGETKSNSAGEFAFESQDSPTVLVRRNERSEWTVRTAFVDGQDIVVGPIVTANLRLLDSAGEAIRGAEFHIAYENHNMLWRALLGTPPSTGIVRETSAGLYEVASLQVGEYRLQVVAEGFALLESKLTLTAEPAVVELQMDRSAPREIRRIDRRCFLLRLLRIDSKPMLVPNLSTNEIPLTMREVK